MKHRYIQMMKKIVAISLLLVLGLSDITYVFADNDEQIAGEETVDPENLIEIFTAEDLFELAENCKLDAYSVRKRVELKNDIDLAGVDFHSIPYFNGVFDGNGYKISNLNVNEMGSQYGLFRYIGELGIVSDLNVLGTVVPTGSQEEIGAIAGVNYGIIQNCTFTGTVYGRKDVGGIAGMSGGTIEKCYAMLDVSGKDYVGGIVGQGSTVLDCISVITIEAEGERIGGIAGFLDEEGVVVGNYFVKDGYDGIDNISYLGVAEPTSYEEIMLSEGIPEGFTLVQVAFEVEDELICETTVAYGSTLTEADFPEIEERDGYYIVWPEKSVYTDICNNLTVVAEYVPWTQSIAAGTENVEKPFFIAVGEFYEGTALHILPVETEFSIAVEGMNVLYSHDWTILSEREKTFESVEAHFYVPDSVEGEVLIWVEEESGWVAVTTTIDGSYVVAQIPYEAAFAVVETLPDMTGTYLTIGAAVLVLILVISIIIVHNKRKKKAK